MTFYYEYTITKLIKYRLVPIPKGDSAENKYPYFLLVFVVDRSMQSCK